MIEEELEISWHKEEAIPKKGFEEIGTKRRKKSQKKVAACKLRRRATNLPRRVREETRHRDLGTWTSATGLGPSTELRGPTRGYRIPNHGDRIPTT